MERMYLLIAGILTGAAVGLLTGHLGWICAGVVMGGLLALFARPRSTPFPTDRPTDR